MKQVVLGNERAWLEDAPDPEPSGEWIVVRMTRTPICGSDMYAFRARETIYGGGHEGVGEVVAVDGARHRRPGDRVALNGSSGCGTCQSCLAGDYILCTAKPPFSGHFQHYVRIQEWLCMPLPADISWDLGALMGCGLCPAFEALKRLGVTAFSTVLVTGLGPVGLGAVALAKFLNARVIAADVEPWRRQRAEEIGADVVLDAAAEGVLAAVRDLTEGRGVPAAVDCSGNPAAERLALDALAPRGRLAFVGENLGTIEVSPSNDLIRRDVEIHGAWHFNLNDAHHLVTFLRRFPQAGKLISHTFGFTQVQEAFDTFASRQAAKVLLDPWS